MEFKEIVEKDILINIHESNKNKAYFENAIDSSIEMYTVLKS